MNEIKGVYKIFSSLKNNPRSTVLNQLNIVHISPKGWFFGNLEYSEIFNEPGARSGGEASVFGKLNYSFFRIGIATLLRAIKLKKYNPLEVTDFGAFHGKLYLLSRNDLDLSKRDWKSMIVQQYSIIHYRDAHRLKLYNPQKGDSYLQIPDEIVLINVDKVPDQLLSFKV